MRRSLLLLAVPLLALTAHAQHPTAQPAYTPDIAPASDEAAKSLASFEPAEGLGVSLVAAEPLLANPVCLYPADDGRIYVVETHRLRAGVIDMRDHADWVLEDLACRTVEDRVAEIHRHFANDLPAWRSEHERIRCLIDDDGDGTADRATVFADRFHTYADGIAAGVIADGDGVWFTSIPSLWQLRDANRRRRGRGAARRSRPATACTSR